MTVDPGSRGWNEHTHVTVERPTDELIFTSDDTTEGQEPLLHIPAGTDSLCAHVPSGYLMLSSSAGSHLAYNAYWDGTNWLRFNVANPSSVWIAGSAGAQLLTTPAGSGNISWSNAFNVSLVGGVGIDTGARGAANLNPAPALIFGGAHPGGSGEAISSNRTTADNQYGLDFWAGGVRRLQIANSGPVSVNSSLSMSGRYVNAVSHTTDIANTPGGTGPFEIGVSGGGAAMMAFHRHGYYAAHFGLDTDNQWKVGGWSMGAASHTLLTTTQTQTMSNKTHSGHFTMTGGYIFGTYINMSADRIESGSPAYVAGQNGDNYLRWWNKSVLVAPLTHLIVQGVSPRSTNWQRAATTWVNRTGYWLVVALNHCHDTSYGGNSRNGVQVVINGADGGSTIFHGNTYGGQIGSWPLKVMWLGVMSNGQEIACNVFAQDWDTNERNTTGQVEAWFIPTPGYMI